MGTEEPCATGSAPFSPTKGDPDKLPQGLSSGWLRPTKNTGGRTLVPSLMLTVRSSHTPWSQDLSPHACCVTTGKFLSLSVPLSLLCGMLWSGCSPMPKHIQVTQTALLVNPY